MGVLNFICSKSYFLILHVWHFAYMCVMHQRGAWCLQRAEEDVRSPWN